MEYYSAIYKNEIVPLATTWIDLEIVILSEESQRDIVWCCSYMESKKKWYSWTRLQNRNGFTDLKNELTIAGGKDGEGIVREFGMNVYTVLYWKGWPTRACCIAHGTLLSVMWQPGWEGRLGESGSISSFAGHLKWSQNCLLRR